MSDLHRPVHPVRLVTASALFDGHDASINIMRRIFQAQGAEVIHLGHNRSVREVVDAALEEDAHGVAVSSYQGGHVEYFEYLVASLRKQGAEHIRVEVDGITVADSRRPRILFETGLPPRYYLPLTDMRMDLLRPSDSETHCPYKGTASYWSVDTGRAEHRDIVWTYRFPLPESQKIAGLACFYTEKVDLFVDGELQ